MLFLTAADVEDLLDLDRLVEGLERAFEDLSARRVSMPPRVAAEVSDLDSFVAAMPSYLPSAAALATKLVSVFPGNEPLGLPSHQAVIVVFDPATGTPVALMDGTYVTTWRTAAGSALSARLLAEPGASVLAVVGTGVQARAHALMVPRVLPIAEVRVSGRSPAKVAALADDLKRSGAPGVRACASIEDAVRGADVVCLATHSPEPVVRREWLAPGAHVTSVGYNPEGRELDEATVVDSLVVVESRDAALAPFPAGSNDLGWPIRDGVIDAGHVHAELGELVAGTRPGRSSPDQLTLYKSVGVAVEDAAAAALVLDEARRQGRGIDLPL